ncbi:MAG: IS110 family transposase, partial [Candidatus Methanoperedens sp.]|nr:IS110 family transposase [Candidatus Methanoperedens sp.]
MNKRWDKACGADVHKRFIDATILTSDGTKKYRRFLTDIDSLLTFRDWLIEEDCPVIALESTGVYWIPINTILEGIIKVLVANAYKIKHTPGRKTDIKDSEWIAELCLNGMIEPSRVFPKEDREIRDLTRAREAIVNSRSQVKNRIHAVLDAANIRLSSVFTDLFGKSGIELVKGLTSGQSIEAIISGTENFWIKKRADEIRQAVKGTLGTTQTFVIKECLEVIKSIDDRVKNFDAEISSRMKAKTEDLKIAMSIPGIGFVAGSTILAEIGDYRDFETPDKLAAWTGIVSSVYQSANKLSLGRITKQGSKHLRWILVEVANAVIKVKGRNKLKSFFLRIKARQGFKKAIVALARKILCILHHLL